MNIIEVFVDDVKTNEGTIHITCIDYDIMHGDLKVGDELIPDPDGVYKYIRKGDFE